MLKNMSSALVIAVVAGLICGRDAAAQDAAKAGQERFEWQVASPESQQMSLSRLEALREKLVQRRTTALVVIRNDRIVYQWYAAGMDGHQPLGTASLAKAIVGGMSLAVPLSDGLISLDDPVSRFVPAWKDDADKSKITIRHLGSHTSGLSDASQPNVPHEKLTGWMGDFWKRLGPPNDPFSIARDKAPVLFSAGREIRYSNPGIAMLTYCVAAALRETPHRDIRLLLRDRVMRPIGVPDGEWTIGYGTAYQVDGLPLRAAWGGGNYSLDAVARIGRLVLRKGDWDGAQVLGSKAIEQITTDAGLVGHCGMGWWTNGGGRWPALPRDAVWGAGAGDRVLLVVPSLGLIAVRHGQALLTADELEQLKPKDVFEEFHDPRERVFFRPLIETVLDRPLEKQAP